MLSFPCIFHMLSKPVHDVADTGDVQGSCDCMDKITTEACTGNTGWERSRSSAAAQLRMRVRVPCRLLLAPFVPVIATALRLHAQQ